MGYTSTSTLLLLLLLLLSTTSISAFNITRILEQYPDFGTFNSYLSRTKVTDEINSRSTITVLAIDNASVAAISGVQDDVLADILRVHVILDYYDLEKLRKLNKKSVAFTTLYQTTGNADRQTGFVNATFQDGAVLLGSANPGEPLTARVVGQVMSRPYNVSVLQVSGVIYPQGIDGTKHPVTLPAAPPPPPAAEEAPAPKGEAPAEAPAADAPASDAPVADAPAADAPATDAPEADAPVADAPAAGAPKAEKEVPTADAPGPSGATDESAVSRVGFCGSIVTAAVAVWLAAVF